MRGDALKGSRLPTQFDHQGTLPDTRALSGIKSQEIQGQGFNQLRFDDTTGQISAQLQSSHATSQLNLGNLSHPKTSETSDSRGEGFELRTDQFGAIRAGKGLLLSTHIQDKAKANHLDTVEAKSQLESTLNSITALSDMAKRQNADPLDVLEDLQSFIAQLQHQSPEQAATFKSAIMLPTSPESIGLSSQANLHICANGQISHSAGDSINLSAQHNLRAQAQQKISLFAAQKGISATAAKGKVALHAQNDGIEAIARKVIQIISTEDRIEITSPKEISLTAGGSQVLLGGQGVLVKTGAKFEVKAGQHVFSGGRKVNISVPALPLTKENQKIKGYILFDTLSEKVLPNRAYRLIKASGESILGMSDRKGFVSEHGEAILEILPEVDQKYIDTAISQSLVATDWVSEDGRKYVIPTDFTVPANRVGSKAFLSLALKKDPSLHKRIADNAKNNYYPDAYPDVPSGAKLISHTDLLKGGGGRIQYSEWFSPTKPTDQGLRACVKSIVKQGLLPDKYYYIFTHANPTLLTYFDKGFLTAPEKIIDILKEEGCRFDKPIVIMACQAGNGENSIAEQLSKQKGVGTVYAMTALGWFSTAAPNYKFIGPYGRFLRKSPRDGILEKNFKGSSEYLILQV